MYNYKTKSATLFRSLRVLSSSLLELCLYKLFCAFPSSTRSSSVNHTHAHTYSLQLQSQEHHSVQGLQNTKQLSPGAVSLQVVLCFSFQYSEFLSEPHTQTHTHTRTYSVQLQSQERHSVQKPQSTKQLSAWSCVSTSCSVLCFPVLEVPQ